MSTFNTPDGSDREKLPSQETANPTVLGRLASIASAVGGAIKYMYEVVTYVPIPSELDGLLTDEDMKKVDKDYYQSYRDALDEAPVKMYGAASSLGFKLESAIQLVEVHSKVRYAKLGPYQQSALKQYLMERYCMVPYMA